MGIENLRVQPTQKITFKKQNKTNVNTSHVKKTTNYISAHVTTLQMSSIESERGEMKIIFRRRGRRVVAADRD